MDKLKKYIKDRRNELQSKLKDEIGSDKMDKVRNESRIDELVARLDELRQLEVQINDWKIDGN